MNENQLKTDLSSGLEPRKLAFQAALLSQQGNRRWNQDAGAIWTDSGRLPARRFVAAVADGSGGTETGGRASRQALSCLAQVDSWKRDVAAELIAADLEDALHKANDAILVMGRDGSSPSSTATCVVFLDRSIIIVHIGDSILIRLRGGCCERLNRPHRAASEGISGPLGLLLVNRLGQEKIVVDRLFDEAKPGDVLVLCTDGVENFVSDEDLLHAVALPIEEGCCYLLSQAAAKGSKDDMTVIIVQVSEMSSPEPSGSSRPIRDGQGTIPGVEAKPPVRRHRWFWLAAGLVLLILAAFLIWRVLRGWGGRKQDNHGETGAPVGLVAVPRRPPVAGGGDQVRFLRVSLSTDSQVGSIADSQKDLAPVMEQLEAQLVIVKKSSLSAPRARSLLAAIANAKAVLPYAGLVVHHFYNQERDETPAYRVSSLLAFLFGGFEELREISLFDHHGVRLASSKIKSSPLGEPTVGAVVRGDELLIHLFLSTGTSPCWVRMSLPLARTTGPLPELAPSSGPGSMDGWLRRRQAEIVLEMLDRTVELETELLLRDPVRTFLAQVNWLPRHACNPVIVYLPSQAWVEFGVSNEIPSQDLPVMADLLLTSPGAPDFEQLPPGWLARARHDDAGRIAWILLGYYGG